MNQTLMETFKNGLKSWRYDVRSSLCCVADVLTEVNMPWCVTVASSLPSDQQHCGGFLARFISWHPGDPDPFEGGSLPLAPNFTPRQFLDELASLGEPGLNCPSTLNLAFNPARLPASVSLRLPDLVPENLQRSSTCGQFLHIATLKVQVCHGLTR